MWNLVASLQQTLDEAAGINTVGAPSAPQPPSDDRDAAVSVPAVSDNSHGDVSREGNSATIVAEGFEDGWEDEKSRSSSRGNSGCGETEHPQPLLGGDEQSRDYCVGVGMNDAAEVSPVMSARTSSPPPPMTATSAQPSEGARSQPELAPHRGAAASDYTSPPPPAALPQTKPNNNEVAIEKAISIANQVATIPEEEVASQAKESALEAQLLRLQARLLEETLAKDTMESELRSAMQQLQQAVSSVADGTSSGVLEKKIRLLEVEGIQLAEQLGHERERCKTLLTEKKTLEKKAEELVATVGELTNREKSFAESREATIRSEAAMREKLSHLQATMMQLNNDFASKSAELVSLQQATASMTNSHGEAEKQLRDELQGQREQYELRLQELGEDVDRHKSELRRSLVEHEMRVSALEREVAQANQRAHAAENRAFEAHRQEHESAQVVMAQSQHDAVNVSRLQTALAQKTRENHTLTSTVTELQKQVSDLEAAGTARVLKHMAAMEAREKELRDCRVHLEREVHRRESVLCRLTATEMELSILHQQLQTAQAAPTTTSTGSISHQFELASPSRSTLLAERDTADTSISGSNATSSEVDAVLHHIITTAPTSSNTLQTTSSTIATSSNHRVEKELARVSVELQRLRGVEAKHDTCRRQLVSLTAQHDVLLQMYGQLEEELQDARDDARDGKVEFKKQIDFLGNEVMIMREQLQVLAPPPSS